MNIARRIIRGLPLVAAVAFAAVMVATAACDDGGDGDATATPPEGTEPGTTATTVAGDEDGEGALHLSLNEWSITDEDGGAIPSVPAGEVTFEAHNDGQTIHELVIIKTDTDPADLPVESGRVDEEAAGEEIGEIEEFAAGGIEVGTFNLEAGNYALICNIPAHYEQGMYAQLVVE